MQADMETLHKTLHSRHVTYQFNHRKSVASAGAGRGHQGKAGRAGGGPPARRAPPLAWKADSLTHAACAPCLAGP